MKKHRVYTTISAKHWELLKKHTAELETQQKVLESALESLDNNSKQIHALSPEDELLKLAHYERTATCILHKPVLKMLLKNIDVKQMAGEIKEINPAEYVATLYYRKPLKKCSLKELMDLCILAHRTGNIADTVEYTDEGSHYSLRMIHSLGINCSEMTRIMNEALFEAYGVRTESEISENSLFMKIYKNSKI